MASETTPKFTPGPWFIRDDRKSPRPYILASTGDMYGTDVVWGQVNPGTGCYFIGDRETCTANAHLIAASPALYEALEKLLQAVDPGGDTSLEPYFKGPVDQARTALRLARGEA